MTQSIHIFRKDAYHLRFEIALFLAISALYAWAWSRQPYPTRGSEWLLAIAAIFLIARVVHAEPIPGDDQFWVTRPYHWMSLAAAKLLFIGAFVCAPICAAQIAMLLALGFPLLSAVQGLLWSQVLIFVASIFAAALAALTSGTALFMLAVLVLAGLSFVAEFAFPFYYPASGVYRFPEPFALEWVRQYLALVLIALTAAFVLHRQYRHRATTLSRATGVIGICLAVSAFLLSPSQLVYAVQSSVTKVPSAANSVQVSVDPLLKTRGAALISGRDPLYNRVRIPIPIAVHGVPASFNSRVDAVALSFSWPGIQSWKPDAAPGVNPRASGPGVSLQDATVLMEPALYRELRTSPLTLTGAAYITLFGDTESRTVTLQQHPVNVQDGLQCFVGDLGYLICRSFFRWPARLVYGESAGRKFSFMNTVISYSPFPAEPDLGVMAWREGGGVSTAKVTLTTQKPLAYFWRRFQIRGIRLSDFEGPEPPAL
jgi:hypothetical protein